jgi:hypothetical protein
VVDLSQLPMVRQFDRKLTLWNRYRGIGLTRSSIRELRSRLAGTLGLAPEGALLNERLDREIDELYLTCLHHPDVLAVCQVLPRARKIYYPHTFDSLCRSELGHLARVCETSTLPRRTLLFNRVKRALWGEDAVPLLRLKVDAAYTFKLPLPWALENHDLSDRITRAVLEKVFDRLPTPVRNYYQDLAAQCGGLTGIFLLNSEDFPQFTLREIEAYEVMAEHLAQQCPGATLLVKMHSRGSQAHTDRVMERLRSRLPGVNFLPVLRYHFYPIEVVLAPFSVVACAGLGTTALRTLGQIYGIDAYCPVDLLRTLYQDDPKIDRDYRRWIEDYEADVIAIAS